MMKLGQTFDEAAIAQFFKEYANADADRRLKAANKPIANIDDMKGEINAADVIATLEVVARMIEANNQTLTKQLQELGVLHQQD